MREFGTPLWTAIAQAWKTPQENLPERSYSENRKTIPYLNKWTSQNPTGFIRWQTLRSAIFAHAAELGIRQDILLKPKLQKKIAWEGWESPAELHTKLAQWGARPWQIAQCMPVIIQAGKHLSE
ncbi:hypothetical protein RQN30_00640 [Arcanobacterium hippocoleae]